MTPAEDEFATSLRSIDAAVASGGEAPQVPLSQLVSAVYAEAPPSVRARLLECLIRPVRPLGLAAVAAGAFGAFLHREAWGHLSISLDDAVRYSAEQVYELSRFVEQAQPEAFRQVAEVLSSSPMVATTLSGSLLLVALRLWNRRLPA